MVVVQSCREGEGWGPARRGGRAYKASAVVGLWQCAHRGCWRGCGGVPAAAATHEVVGRGRGARQLPSAPAPPFHALASNPPPIQCRAARSFFLHSPLVWPGTHTAGLSPTPLEHGITLPPSTRLAGFLRRPICDSGALLRAAAPLSLLVRYNANQETGVHPKRRGAGASSKHQSPARPDWSLTQLAAQQAAWHLPLHADRCRTCTGSAALVFCYRLFVSTLAGMGSIRAYTHALHLSIACSAHIPTAGAVAVVAVVAGCCWVMQWMLPPPSTISRVGTATTRRPGKASASACCALQEGWQWRETGRSE